MKILILGRTASGKDTVANNLEKYYGLKRVVSYTDRPQREGEPDDSHTFVTTEEIEKLIPDMVAMTKINGYTYGATYQQVEDADIYVIDPDGYEAITKAMPNTAFTVIYVKSADDEQRKNHFLEREANNMHAKDIWDARNESEDLQFTNFELMFTEIEAMQNTPLQELPFPVNTTNLVSMINDYSEDFLNPDVVAGFAYDVNLSENVRDMIWELVQENEMTINSPMGLPLSIQKPEDLDLFASRIISNPEELMRIMTSWASYKKHRLV